VPLVTATDATRSARETAYLDALDDLCAGIDAPVESRVVDARDPGDRLHYLVAGDDTDAHATGDADADDAATDREPLVCLHGLGANAGIWAPLFDALADRYVLHVPERPGRGLSDPVDYGEVAFRRYGVDYLTDFLDAVGLDAPAVLASSLGGFQGLALAVDRPGRVDRLCLPGAPAGLSRTPPLAVRLLGLPVVGDWLADYTRPTTVAEARAVYGRINVVDPSAVPEALLRLELRENDLPGRPESLQSLTRSLGSLRAGARVRAAYDLRPDLSAVDVPTRFVWGAEDYFWPPSVGRPVADAMPDARLRVLDDHGHVPWLEPGAEATRAIRDALALAGPGAGAGDDADATADGGTSAGATGSDVA
jgi:pimeloyl-ACP methyl ester carboxylesterase